MFPSMEMEDSLESELSDMFLVKLVAKRIVYGYPKTSVNFGFTALSLSLSFSLSSVMSLSKDTCKS